MNKKLTSLQAAKLSAISTVFFFLIVFGYRFLNLGFSGDAMIIDQASSGAYQATLGRFLQPVYWKIRGSLSVPMTIGLFSVLFLALSSVILVTLLHLRTPLAILSASAVVSLNETICISVASYIPWLDVYALALLLSLLGVYAFCHIRRGKLICICCFCLSMGLYQSYIQAGIALFILLLLLRLIDGDQTKSIWQDGVQMCLVLVVSLLIYLIVYRSILTIWGLQVNNDYNGPARIIDRNLSDIPQTLIETYLLPLRYFFDPATVTILPQGFSIFLGIATLFSLFTLARRCTFSANLTILFLLGMLPFGMNFVYFISDGLIHALMVYAYFMYFLMCISLLERHAAFCRITVKRIISVLGSIILSGSLYISTLTTQQMFLKHDIQFSANTAAFSRIMQRIDQTPGYNPGSMPVCFHGYPTGSHISSERPGFEKLATLLGMRYTYAVAYQAAIPWYIHYALGYPCELILAEDLSTTQQEILSEMPCFPSDGCARIVDGVLLFHM